MDISISLAQSIEEISANAWPARIRQTMGCWQLRAFDGITKRANSVLPLYKMPDYEWWMDEVDRFYQRQTLPIRFQISDVSPHPLDDMLAAWGYQFEGQSAVYTATCHEILACAHIDDALQVIVSPTLTQEWMEAFIQIEKIPLHRKAFYQEMFRTIGLQQGFIQVQFHGECVGIGTAVLERGWAGLFNLATAQHFRRQGVATCAIHALASWSLQNGAENVYLQVVSDNDKALALYRKLGFRHLYHYHYRTKC